MHTFNSATSINDLGTCKAVNYSLQCKISHTREVSPAQVILGGNMCLVLVFFLPVAALYFLGEMSSDGISLLSFSA